MHLLRTFSEETYLRALEDWSWLDLTGKAPLCTSPFGDVFLQGLDGIWCLDMLEGRLHVVFADTASMREVLESEEGQDRYLLAGLALGAERQGRHLGRDDVYVFRVPPVLGGPMDVASIEVMSFVVASSINAQIHRQVKDLPAGTAISGFTVDGADPGKSTKRRGLFGGRR